MSSFGVFQNLSHEERMAKIWADIERDRLAELERLYGEKKVPVETPSEEGSYDGWTAIDGHFEKRLDGKRGPRLIHGIASSSAMSLKGEVKIARGMGACFPIPLLWAHKNWGSIGEIYYVRKSDRLVYVRAEVFCHEAGDYAWKLITSGEFNCLSVGPGSSFRVQAIVDDHRFFDRWTLKEVSVCRQGANPDAVFEILNPGDDGRKFWGGSKASAVEALRLPYQGIWKAAEYYQPGQFVTHDGSLWHAQIQAKGVKPGTAPGIWKLAVKRGKADRLEVRPNAV